ncbi:MAG: CPBP family glutamic-type intramembrane protease [Thermomicrobiales bacterium]
MADFIAIFVTLGLIAVAFGMAFWVYHARHDRSANVGLYLLLGFPGVLLVIAGAAFAINGQRDGLTFLLIGLALSLPLMSRFRQLVARAIPIDPASSVHMVGLALMLTVVLTLTISLVNVGDTPDALAAGSIGYVEVLAQNVFLVAAAYAAVGAGVARGVRDASLRLGLTWPTPRVIAISIGFVLLGFIIAGAAGIATSIFQPELADRIDTSMLDATSELQNPLGAVVLGASAGMGEELLLRGAIQPRFGIVLTAALFALLHTQYGFSWIIVGLFGVGLLLGYERIRYGTTAAILTHAIYNTISVLLSSS